MRTILVAISLVLTTGVSAQTSVDGCYRKDGTCVPPHMRTNPNGTTYDNWSTRGNVNPYTGQMGTQNPQPSYQAPAYGYGTNSLNQYGSQRRY